MTHSNRQLTWINITLIAFVSIWNLSNVFNNYAQQGLAIMTSWILILILYLAPYLYIVSTLGQQFYDESAGGITSWIRILGSRKLSYFTAWTFWATNFVYLAQKPQNIIIAGAWLFTDNGNFVKTQHSALFAVLCLIVFLITMWLSSRGMLTIKRIGSLAGIAMVLMSFVFIVLALLVVFNPHVHIASAHMNRLSTYIPKFNWHYVTTISFLVFAVGGADKLSPYVQQTKTKNGFGKGLTGLFVLVAISVVLGTFALGILFNTNAIPKDLLANGAYEAFAKLGKIYHVGSLLTEIYAFANLAAQIAAMVISIDAPIRIFLNDQDDDHQYIPRWLSKRNSRGVPINGYLLTTIIVTPLILLPAFGIGNINQLFIWLLSLATVILPLRFLWTFFAFMRLNLQHKKYPTYQHNPVFGFVIGAWCFALTAFACVLGMAPKTSYQTNPTQWWFQLLMNVITPFILIIIGLILPKIARRENEA